MLPFQIVAVGIRLFAICLGISALRMIPTLVTSGGDERPGAVYAWFLFALLGAICMILWIFPRLVSGKIVGPNVEPTDSTPVPDKWLAVGCALIGLWVLSSSLPALIRDAFIVYWLGSKYGDSSRLQPWVLYNSIEVAISLWLIFGTNGFRRLFWWSRDAGISKPL